jgi:hypothetical protein
MYIYHYSKKRFNELRSLSHQRNETKKELDDINKKYTQTMAPGPYANNISFFIEPIPIDILGDLFDNKHQVWFNGNHLYEYFIDVESLDKNILFNIVETPDDTKLMDSKDTDSMSDDEFDTYMRLKMTNKYSRGEIGIGRNNLIHQISRFLGTIRQAFIDARSRTDAKDTVNKYAANVPHLMLYPESGIIQYKRVEQIVIGK